MVNFTLRKFHLNIYIYIFFFFFATPCSMWDLSSQSRDRTHAPARKQSLNHWANRVVFFFFNI